MQLERMWQQMSAAYNYLLLVYQNRGYLTPYETNYANQLHQMLTVLQAQKIQADQDLWNELMKHLAKMIMKQ